MPKCKTCGKTHAEVAFYDSIKTYCKEHWRERVRANRLANIKQYRSYHRQRANRPDRVAARAEYAKTDRYIELHRKSTERYTRQRPERRRAQNAVNNAIRDGKLKPLECFVCGNKAEAHHPDYSQPLDVMWLCDKHHKETHKLFREIERENANQPIRP